MSYLLDTNVVSAMAKPPIDEGVGRFLEGAEEDELYLSVVTVAELRYGIERLPAGTKRANLEKWLEGELIPRFENRIFVMDGFAAMEWGRIKARAERMGRPISEMDAWMAATAAVHGLTIVTRNVDDFASFLGKLLNPWE